MTDPMIRDRNIDRAFEVVFAAVSDEVARQELQALGVDGGLVITDPNDPELSLANEEMAERLRARGEQVVLVELQKRVSLQTR